jgi:hypothetical protein
MANIAARAPALRGESSLGAALSGLPGRENAIKIARRSRRRGARK